MSNGDGGVDVVLEEDLLDSEHLGLELIHELNQFKTDLSQSGCQLILSIGPNHADGVSLATTARAGFNNCVATPSEAWVYSEHEHLYDRSAFSAPLSPSSADKDWMPNNATEDLVVNVVNVSRWFGDVQALTNLTLKVPQGKITVLLGPNGAGKTTAIRVITGALAANEGHTEVFGLDPATADGEEVRSRCGVVSAKPSLYDRLSGWDNLRYAAELYDLGRGRVADNRIGEAANMFAIDASLDLQVGGYSTGMKTRLALARAVLHNPDLLLLDEPTSGLDPESAAAVLELIQEMTAEGRTVLMCTHLLMEAEGLADHIVVMEHGTSLLDGAPNELASRYWPAPIVHLSSELGDDLDVLATVPGVASYERSATTARLELDTMDRVPDLLISLAQSGARITKVDPFQPTLEDLYFAVRRGNGAAESEKITVAPNNPAVSNNTPANNTPANNTPANNTVSSNL